MFYDSFMLVFQNFAAVLKNRIAYEKENAWLWESKGGHRPMCTF